MSVTRITHQAATQLGLAQSVTKAYQVRLRLSGDPRFVLPAEGVETLECVRSRSERRDARVLQPDVIIGSSLGRYVFGSEISYNKPPPRLPGLGC